MDQKEPQVEVSWLPATPAKPILIKPVPICEPEEQNQQLGCKHDNEAVACYEFSAGAVPGTTLANSISGNGKTCVQTASDNFSGWSKLGFSELLFLTEAGSGMLPDNHNGLDNPFIPSLMSQFNGDVQGTSHTACCSKETSQNMLPPDIAIRAESEQIASMHINVEEKGPHGEEENISAKTLGDNATSPSKELSEPVVEFAAVSTQLKENDNPDYGSSHDIDLSKTPQQKTKRRRKHRPKVIIEGKPKRTRKPATQKPAQAKETPTVKRKYVRKKGLNNTSISPTEMMGELTEEINPESAKQPCRRSLNFDIGPIDESSACRENATAHMGKETGVVEQQTNENLAHDLSTITSPSKENPPEKRKYVRRKKMSKTSAPTIEVTGELPKAVMTESAKTSCGKSLDFGIGASDQSLAGIENATVHLGNEIDVAAQETNVGLAYDLKTSTEKASNNYMPLSKDTQVPSTSSSRSTPPAAEAKEDATTKRKYVRRKGPNKSTLSSAEMAPALTEPVVPDSTNMSWRSSSGKQNLSEHITMDNNSKQEDIQAPRTCPARSNFSVANPEEKVASKRKYARRKRLSKSSTPPAEMTADLIQPTMLESTEIEQRRSLYFDAGARDESSACRQNLNVHNSKENSVVAEGTHAGLTYDQGTSMKHALYNFMSLPEDTQVPSTSSKSNPPGAKLNGNSVENRSRKNGQATIQDGHENSAKLLLKSVRESNPNDTNISNSQISMLRLQMVGSKRSHSGTIRFADTSSMNEIGAYYNGFPSYQNMFRIQFPNLQKRPRSENGKSSNAPITSSVTTIKEAELTSSHEVAQVHPYASSSRCWNFCSEYNAARVPTISEATGSVIDDDQAFEEFKLSLRRAQIYDCASLTRIRNFDTEPNYSAHELCIYGRQTFGNAQKSQTSIDALVTKTSASLTKNKNKSVVSRSSYSTINEMQQCQNLALGNYHQSLAAISSEVRRSIILHVNALSEKLSQLNINKEAKDLALVPYKKKKKKRSLVNGDGTIIPFNGSFSPIRKQLPRPKVDIDEETDRVWKLLMLDINSHGIDGTDEDKAKWWEDERNVFRGRADSFIARMHLVQGDRRFTRWKGSVLDSVVGVFLTQNVSDHLSSSAFMSLAARYPKKFSETYHGEGTGLVANEPQVHIVEPEESTEWDSKILDKSVYDHSSMTIDIAEHSGEKADNSSSRTTDGVISITYESSCRLSESSQRNTGKQYSPTRSGLISTTSEEGEEKSCYEGVRKELNDIVSSQGSVISSQISGDSSNDQNPEKIGSCSDSNSEVENLSSTAKHNSFYNSTSFSKLVEMASSSKLYEVNSKKCNSTEHLRDAFGLGMMHDQSAENLEKSNLIEGSLEASIITSHPIQKDISRNEINEISSAPVQLHSRGQAKDKNEDINWDILRIQAQAKAGKREKTKDTMDSLDWEAVRCADVNEIANTIKERGMNNRLADRIKNFLNRLVEEHGDIDLEWLRDVPPDQAKEYLLSVKGLGLKSVECVRLLTLHHLAFPVDTNVGRIAVRLGWVPIQPLPESLQLHLLELYPILESIQKYLWPRLCKLDQKTLYELHYQMITFGKVFCTKSKPNCNACPMRAECRHFASAFASARLALPGPEQKSIVSTLGNNVNDQNPPVIFNQLYLQPAENTNQAEDIQQTELSRQLYSKPEINNCQPIIEEPTTPEPECSQLPQDDIEDAFYYDDSCEIPTIKLNMEEFTTNLQNYMQQNMALQEGEMSKALVSLNPEAASIPVPKLKNVSRLRTEHCVYELPDTHPLLEGWDTREPDDPGKYLLAIWTPGETADSIQPPGSKCNSLECGQLCNEKECFSCNSFREANAQTVRGTILIPCRTAMRGSFPLNGTYFQVNEVFADHDSSLDPISVPRSWIWNLNRRTVYFGTSIPTIFKGLSTQDIQQCFWRGYVCVRGFDKKTRAPRPLMARLHFPASKMPKTTEKTRKKSTLGTSQGLEPNLEHPELEPELITNGHNLQETASKMANTKEKKRKRSTPKNSKGLKPNPEQPQLITNGHRLQETDSKMASAKERKTNKSIPESSQDSKPNPENKELIPDGPNLEEAATA
ncbi:PREDICTED: protein ROS1-like isoform X1 [Lupinus angustifolius]|uniref:protein ROS1-like isoform X1 n=1 Tax=Lupinus angustifolius TaxID=3871 RepID=UPI00092E82EB|nr:PREDICTED: protein ROS1-like isoform X1 [Lupinus angustifolius]